MNPAIPLLAPHKKSHTLRCGIFYTLLNFADLQVLLSLLLLVVHLR